MRTLRSWFVVGGIIFRYALSRIGLAAVPTFEGHYDEGVLVFSQAMGWRRNMRILCHGYTPGEHPVVYAGNHYRLDDPLIMFAAIYEVSGGKDPKIMMRDDFLRGSLFDSRLIDANTFLVCLGGISINRFNVQLSQLKPFLKVLERGQSFLMYPGRTRSRSGLFFEYRDEVQEPGGVSFFLNSAQRRNPEVPIGAVPVARSRNPATGLNTIVFGAPRYIESGASREEQREFDRQLVGAMSDLVEIHAAHVVAGMLYLKALHGDIVPFDERELEAAMPRIFAALGERLIDPEAVAHGPREIDRALRLFERKGFIERRGSMVAPRAARILSVPQPGETYRKVQLLKYTLNQVIHFADFVEALEREVLG